MQAEALIKCKMPFCENGNEDNYRLLYQVLHFDEQDNPKHYMSTCFYESKHFLRNEPSRSTVPLKHHQCNIIIVKLAPTMQYFYRMSKNLYHV